MQKESIKANAFQQHQISLDDLLTQIQNGLTNAQTSGSGPSAASLSTLVTCLQKAFTDGLTNPQTGITEGGTCIQNFAISLGPQAKCFQDNGFSAQALQAAITAILSGKTPTPPNIPGLIACLQGTPSPTITGGGGESVASSPSASATPTVTVVVAQPAEAIVATPNFTG